jgi:hypothetical protein
MRGQAEMQACSAHCFGQFSGGVAVRAHLGGGPVAHAAVVHRKTIVVFRDRHYIFRACLFE